MELKQNPWSLYDFLGYFAPGAIFIYCVMGIFSHAGGLGIDEVLSFEKRQMYLPFVLSAYIAGHMLSFISSVLIEKYSEWTVGYPSKYLLGFKPNPYLIGSKRNKIIRILVALFLLPISFTEYLLNMIFGYRKIYSKQLDNLLIEIIRKKTGKLLAEQTGLTEVPEDSDPSKDDFFRFVYHYTVETAPTHFPKMQNYVALYGFLRTMSLIFVLLFWAVLIHLFMHEYSYLAVILILILTCFINIVLYMAFVKFYKRFTLEAFMALAVTFSTSK